MNQFYVLHLPFSGKPFIEQVDVEDVIMREDAEFRNDIERIVNEFDALQGFHDSIYESIHSFSEREEFLVIRNILRLKLYPIRVFKDAFELRAFNPRGEFLKKLKEDAIKYISFEEYSPHYNQLTLDSVNRNFVDDEITFSGDYKCEKYSKNVRDAYDRSYVLKYDYLVARTYSDHVKKILGRKALQDGDAYFKFKKKWLTEDEADLLRFNGLPVHDNYIK